MNDRGNARGSLILLAMASALMLACTPKNTAEQAPKSEADDGPSSASAPANTNKRPTPKKKAALAPMPTDLVATVGGQTISRADFDALYEPGAQRLMKRRGDGIVPDAYQASQRGKILEQLIWSKLLELEAARLGKDYDPATLAQMERDERTDVKDWDARLDALGQTPKTRRDMNINYLRERVLLEAASGPLAPTDAEYQAAYEANKERFVAREEVARASHLLFAFGPRAEGERILPAPKPARDAASKEELAAWDAASLARAEAMRAQVLKPGVDFNEFAKKYSEGPGAFRGGDMGIFPKKQMVREYAEAAFSRKVGEVSAPVRSSKGYYVIRLFGRYAPGPLPLEAVRPDLKREIESSKYREARASLRAALEERYGVESPALETAQAFRDASRGRARPGPARTAAVKGGAQAPPISSRPGPKPAAPAPAPK